MNRVDFCEPGPSFPDFGTSIFRAFSCAPYIDQQFKPAKLSIALSTPTQLSRLKFGASQELSISPGVSTALKIARSRLSFGVSSTHTIRTPELKFSEIDSYADDEPLFTRSHDGYEFGVEVHSEHYGNLALIRKINGVELLASPPTVDFAGTTLEVGLQVMCSQDEHRRSWNPSSAVGFSMG